MGITYHENTHIFHLFTESTSYQILLFQNAYPLHLYWGHRILEDLPASHLETAYRRNTILTQTPIDDPMFSREYLPFEYPCYGTSDFRSPAYQTVDCDGYRITDPRYIRHQILPGKPSMGPLPSSCCESDDEAQTLIITLLDRPHNLQIDLYYTVFPAYDVITRHTEFTNLSDRPIHLTRALSVSLDIKHGPAQMMELCGTALRETHVERRSLGTGMNGFESRRGFSSHQHNPFVALMNEDTTETSGEVFALSLVYSGSFTMQAERDMYGGIRLQSGINPCEFDWLLTSGEKFHTPEALMVYSCCGLERMSLTFHHFLRERIARGRFRFEPRPILLNTWEACYFTFTQESIMTLAKAAAKAGIELLVLDDGWFGRRDNDHSSLGDWYPDHTKLPNGISGLCEEINSLGLQMGLWFEPEMVSPDSALYRAHPDWCIHVPRYPRTQWRHQLVLDLSRKDVCDYLVQSVSSILSSCPIQYVKWDCNRRITEAASELLPAERSGEFFHRYMLGLYDVLQRITSRFPDVLFENCASGGGRFDPAMMCYFSQNWASDNTDAVSRLKIQHGASMVYPPLWITSHISASPNHQLDRPTPMEFRQHVSQPFNLGYELNLLQMSDSELAAVAQQIKTYQQLRPLIQFGDFYRLRSPFDGNETAWMISAEHGRHILVWYYKPYAQAEEAYLGIKLRHLDETAHYRLLDSDQIYSGSTLMYAGLTIDWHNGDHFSQFWHFERIADAAVSTEAVQEESL